MLEKHNAECHATPKLSCNLCDFESNFYTDLLKHKIEKHAGGPTSDMDMFMNSGSSAECCPRAVGQI